MPSGELTARVTLERARRVLETAAARVAAASDAGHPVAAVAPSGAPLEILRAFGVTPFSPPAYAMDLAAKGRALLPILHAESAGYSDLSCALMKAHMGSVFAGRAPRPSLVVANSVGCSGYLRWFEHLARATGAPLVVIDVPFARTEDAVPADVPYVVRQLRSLIGVCEELTGRRFDEVALRAALSRSARAERAWARCRALCRQRPAPFDAYFDSSLLAGPVDLLRGTEEVAETLEASAEALSVLATIRHSPVGVERFRLVVEGAPPYAAIDDFRGHLARWGAVAVASTHSCVGGFFEHGFEHEAARPLESIAEHMLRENMTNRSLTDQAARVKKFVRDYDADGVVLHAAKTCRIYSVGLDALERTLAEELGLPVLLLESDTADPRHYSSATMKSRIDAFFRRLEHDGRGRA